MASTDSMRFSASQRGAVPHHAEMLRPVPQQRRQGFLAHPYALLQMEIGSAKLGPVGLTTEFNGILYHIQYGYTTGDGSNQPLYTRLSATQWEVQTIAGQDVGRLVSGDFGRTQTYVGLYHVPVDFIITQL